jgi:hypothetical protein
MNFAEGAEFEMGGQRYRVTRLDPAHVAAVRWIKSRQKWSSNAYLYSIAHIQSQRAPKA